MMNAYRPFTINIRGKLKTFDRPAVMGIVNITPDSFYSGSRTPASMTCEIEQRVDEMLCNDVDIIDIGAYSSRPGADDIPATEEISRLATGLGIIRKLAPDIPVSVDTFRAEVAKTAITDLGADIINDISGGDLDNKMFDTVAKLQVPYILMHMRGTPATMQQLTDYGSRGVTASVLDDLGEKINRLALLGVKDIIVDPGFGFSKTLEQNYELMNNLRMFTRLEAPILVGISRKSMITRLLDIEAKDALEGTTALNALALDRGASILRVHDVKAARETVRIFCAVNRIG